MSDFKAVFFDLDGTLWDKAGCADYALDVVGTRFASEFKDDETPEFAQRFNAALLDQVRRHGLRTALSSAGPRRFAALLANGGDRGAALAQEVNTQFNSTRRLGMRGFVRDGATRVLGRLRDAGLKIGIVTNGSYAVQRHTVQALNLEPYIEHLVIGEVEQFHKPDPRLFECALKAAGVAADEMLFVGDSVITDVLGATRAKIPVAWIHGPDDRLPNGFPAPDYDIEYLREVIGIVGLT